MSMPTNTTRRPTLASILTLLVVAIFGLSACDGMMGAAEDGNARLRVRMIDAPFPFELVDSAAVTISRVDVHPEGSGGPITIAAETETFNLLELQNGVSALLGDVEVQAGTYREVRLNVEEAWIVLKDGTKFSMKVPSDRIKVLLDNLTIDEGEDVTLTIDFDVSKSFVVQGNPLTPAGIKGFLFKPTVVPAGIDRRGEDDDASNEVEGSIEVVGADYLEIDGIRYLITDETEFDDVAFDALEAGMAVEIEYVEDEEGVRTATKVELDDEEVGDDESDELEAEGAIQVVGADYIEVDGIRYLITTDTAFEGGTFETLEVDAWVEIEYVEAENGTLVATEIEIEDGEDAEEENEEGGA